MTLCRSVRSRFYPRLSIQTPGVGAMSSMFFLGPAGKQRFDDFRGAVHDSDGLEIWTGSGERLWRTLSNPSAVQGRAFQDHNPKRSEERRVWKECVSKGRFRWGRYNYNKKK